jgi:hypothetical protein
VRRWLPADGQSQYDVPPTADASKTGRRPAGTATREKEPKAPSTNPVGTAPELTVLGNEPADGDPGLRLCRVDRATGELGPVVETAAPGRRAMDATREKRPVRGRRRRRGGGGGVPPRRRDGVVDRGEPPADRGDDAGGAWPWGLGLSPDGERLYAANYKGDRVTPFSVGADGSLDRDGDSLELSSPYFVSIL